MEDVKMTAKSTTLILQCFRLHATQSRCRYVLRSRHECMQRQLTETELTCGWSEQRRVFSREQEGPWRAFIVHPGYKHFYLRLKHAMVGTWVSNSNNRAPIQPLLQGQ